MATLLGEEIKSTAARRMLGVALALSLAATLVSPSSAASSAAEIHSAAQHVAGRDDYTTASSPTAWSIVLDSRFGGGRAAAWPLGQLDNGTSSIKSGRYVLHTADGYFAIRAPRGIQPLSDGRITATVRLQGRGQAGLYGRWYSAEGPTEHGYLLGRGWRSLRLYDLAGRFTHEHSHPTYQRGH